MAVSYRGLGLAGSRKNLTSASNKTRLSRRFNRPAGALPTSSCGWVNLLAGKAFEGKNKQWIPTDKAVSLRVMTVMNRQDILHCIQITVLFLDYPVIFFGSEKDSVICSGINSYHCLMPSPVRRSLFYFFYLYKVKIKHYLQCDW